MILTLSVQDTSAKSVRSCLHLFSIQSHISRERKQAKTPTAPLSSIRFPYTSGRIENQQLSPDCFLPLPPQPRPLNALTIAPSHIAASIHKATQGKIKKKEQNRINPQRYNSIGENTKRARARYPHNEQEQHRGDKPSEKSVQQNRPRSMGMEKKKPHPPLYNLHRVTQNKGASSLPSCCNKIQNEIIQNQCCQATCSPRNEQQVDVPMVTFQRVTQEPHSTKTQRSNKEGNTKRIT